MFGLFRREKKEPGNYFLALDIGTEVVKALICASEGRKARIIGVGRTRQNLGDMQGGVVTDIASVIEHCKRAIDLAQKKCGVFPNQLIMGIAGELVKGTTMVTTYVRKEPDVKIDLAELKNIVHKMQWKAFEQARGELSQETGIPEIEVKLVHAAITDVRIDGYRVSNPIGFQGKEVTVSIFNAFAPLVHYGALQTVASELDLDLLAIAAEPYAVSRSLAYEEGADYSGIFIDIGGGTTDIAVVRNGALEGTKMFTIGGISFTKRLSQALNISYQEAEDIKLAYSSSELEKQSEKICKEALVSDIEIWLSGITLTLSEFHNIDVLPSYIYLCGGGSLLPEIKEALEAPQWQAKLPFAKQPQIRFLLPKHATNIIDETKQLLSTQDVTPMALANLALELASEERLLSKLLRKVTRFMQV